MKNVYLYFVMMFVLMACILVILAFGYFQHSPNTIENITFPSFNIEHILGDIKTVLIRQFHHPISILLIQIVIIMVTTRIFGLIATKVLLPLVVGEIIAGVFLGPSFFGAMFPEYLATIFPTDSLDNLGLISQLGLIFFMFIIGMDFDWQNLKNQTKATIVISHTSIVFPFFLGVLLALFLYDIYTPKNQNTSFIPFALFIGISMSITAFPVLARIVKEKKLTNTKYGTMALACAATDDATAWYILAIIIAISSSTSFIASVLSFGLILIYMIVMLYVVRPFLAWIGNIYSNKDTLDMKVVSIVLTVLLLSSLATEAIGIHALFGAFIAGAMMPSNDESKLRELLIPKLEYISILVLLPLFFAITGLRTQIGLMENSTQWTMCAIVIVVAIVGKLFSATLSAKYMGFSWRESFSIGTLMNTRGLMELVVLNIGFELGIIGAELFAIFVLMALVTTMMTGPLLYIINYKDTHK